MRWTSLRSAVAEVYGDGLVVGIQPGTTWVQGVYDGQPVAQCAVSVSGAERRSVDPSTLRQYADDRRFEVGGRVCFGSELNGQRAEGDDERRFVSDNRVVNPTPIDPRHPLEWEVAEGTPIYDGAGVQMGTVAPTTSAGRGATVPSSKFNFGMSKVLNGRLHLYAFAVKIRPSPHVRQLAGGEIDADGTLRTSAWLPLDRVVDQDTLLERVGLGKVRLPHLPLSPVSYRITGGDPARYMTEHGELRIVRDPRSGAVPSHYLRRPSGTVNIIYSVPGFGLGGQGLDSFLVTNEVTFRPALGVRRFVRPTYFPAEHPLRGRRSGKTMTFVYGAASAPGVEPVYGWVAAEALGYGGTASRLR